MDEYPVSMWSKADQHRPRSHRREPQSAYDGDRAFEQFHVPIFRRGDIPLRPTRNPPGKDESVLYLAAGDATRYALALDFVTVAFNLIAKGPLTPRRLPGPLSIVVTRRELVAAKWLPLFSAIRCQVIRSLTPLP